MPLRNFVVGMTLLSGTLYGALQPLAARPIIEPRRAATLSAEAQVKIIEKRRFTAMTKLDRPVLERVLANDLVYTHTSGAVDTKASLLAALTSGKIRYLSVQIAESRVQSFTDCVLLTGRGSMEVSAGGRKMKFKMRFTDVYARRNGRWQLIAWQSTKLPN